MMILPLTSFGFGVVAFVAAVYNQIDYCGLLIALCFCSTLHQANFTDHTRYFGGNIISKLDRLLARIITIRCFYDSLFIDNPLPIWISIIYVIFIYKLKVEPIGIYENKIYYFHASIHLVSQLGAIYTIINK
jgi:hypothetical protein